MESPSWDGLVSRPPLFFGPNIQVRMGMAMVSRKKRATTKSKGGRTRATMRKKTLKRAAAKRTKKSAEGRTTKTHRSGLSKRIQSRQQKRGATPVVEETVLDIVDEPLPGVVRITEIEEMEVAVPDTEEDEE